VTAINQRNAPPRGGKPQSKRLPGYRAIFYMADAGQAFYLSLFQSYTKRYSL
jgi:hypothetical protein